MSDEQKAQTGWSGVRPWVLAVKVVPVVALVGGLAFYLTHPPIVSLAAAGTMMQGKVAAVDPADLRPSVRVTVPPAPRATPRQIAVADIGAADGPAPSAPPVLPPAPVAASPVPVSSPAGPATLSPSQQRAQADAAAVDAPLSAAAPANQVAAAPAPTRTPGAVIAPPSGTFLAPHTEIDVTLYSSLDSTIPGGITGYVGRDVLDYFERSVLIPRNSKIVGHMASNTMQPGQTRIGVVWEGIVLPNGHEIVLENEPGIDLTGTTGFGAAIDNHTRKELLNVVAFSILAAGAQLAQPQNVCNGSGGCAPSVGQSIGQALGTQISNVATSAYNRSANIPPTAHVVEGAQVGVAITSYLALPPWNPAQ